MDLSKILSISGKPGLYKMIGESKSGLVVESFTDGKKIPAFAHERISSLKEISIYTESDDIALWKVLRKLSELQEGKPIENPKKASTADLKTLFEKVIPDYDKDTVYVSDMKKVFSWYNQLLEKDMLDFTEQEAEEKEMEEEAGSQESEAVKEKTEEEPDKTDA